MGLGGLGYPAPFLWVVTGQLLGLQVGKLLWLVRGGQLVFCLCLDNHLRKEMTQEDPELGGLGGSRGQLPSSGVGTDQLPGLSSA